MQRALTSLGDSRSFPFSARATPLPFDRAPARLESTIASCSWLLVVTCFECVRPSGFVGSVKLVSPGRFDARGVAEGAPAALGLSCNKSVGAPNR